MEKELISMKLSRPPGRRSINASSLAFDLPALIENMKHERTWEKGDLNAMILLRSTTKQIVLTILHKGTEIRSFQANDSITFQVIDGRLELHFRKESITINKGELLTIKEKIKYSLYSMEETAYLLTISAGKLQQAEN